MTTHTKAQLLAGVKAGADLSSNQYFAVKLDANGDVVLAGAGEGIGILLNAPQSGDSADVAIPGGGALAKAGAAIDEGAYLKSNASGKLVVADTDGDQYVAIAITAAASDDVFHVIPALGYMSIPA